MESVCDRLLMRQSVKVPIVFLFWLILNSLHGRFPRSSVDKESACKAGDPGSIPGLGRSPEVGNANPLQYFCLEKPMDGGAWWAAIHGVARVGHDLATNPPWQIQKIQSFH